MTTQPTNEQEQILKAIQTSEFSNGGLLNPIRQNEFLKYIRTYSKMLNMVRFETLSHSQQVLDKFYIGEPVSYAVGENDGTEYEAGVQTSQIALQTKKLKSNWNVTTEVLVENIEQQGFEQTLMQGMSQRISTDIELLAIQGDEVAYNGATDVFGRLLKRQDGWDKLTSNSHILDAGAASIQKGIFAEMVRMMPQQYLNDPNLRWFVSKSTAIDWMDLLADRGTAMGDNALNGNSVSPYGIPLVEVPLIPDSKPLSVKSGTPAKVIGNRQDPFTFVTGVNDSLKIAVDGAAPVTVVFPAGTFQVGHVAALINGTTGLAGIATDNTFGKLVLTSTTTGTGSTLSIQAVANDVYATLGLSTALTTGTNTGTAGNIPEGTFIWLANPKNFIAAMRGNTRVYNWFNLHYDRLETVIYNEVDFSIENDDAIVKAINVRKRQLI
jgi:hypothetical protein